MDLVLQPHLYKRPRPGTLKYRTNAGEEVYLYAEEATHYPGQLTQGGPLDHISEDTLTQLANKILDERVQKAYDQSLLPERRKFEPEDLARFIWDQCNRSKHLHPGETTRQYMLKKWGSAWGTSQKAALAENSGVTGGYAVPWEMFEPMGQTIAHTSILRSNGAFRVTMQTAEMQMPNPVTTTTPSGVSNSFGGMTFSWTPEATLRADNPPAFKGFSLKLWELSGTVTASGPIIDDAPGLSSWLRKAIPLDIGWLEDYAFLVGTGAGQPQGILGAKATIQVNRKAGGTIQYQDYGTLMSKMLPGSVGRGIFLCSPSALLALLQLTDGASRAVVITVGANGQPQLSLGPNRLFVSDALPPLGTNGDLMFIDPAFYCIGDYERDNGTLEIAASIHVKFLQNQLVLRVVRRVDGRPMLDQPVTLQDGSTQVSPFVALN